MSDNRPWSEIFYQDALDAIDAECAASLLEDLKSAFLAEKVALMGDMPVNRAENTVKASREWRDYIEKMTAARRLANQKKVKVEFDRMKHREWISADANERTQARL